MFTASEIKNFVDLKRRQLNKEKSKIYPSQRSELNKDVTKAINNEEVSANAQEIIQNVTKSTLNDNQDDSDQQNTKNKPINILTSNHEEYRVDQKTEKELNNQFSDDNNAISALNEEEARIVESRDEDFEEADSDNFDLECAVNTEDQHSDVDISKLIRKYSGLNIGMLRAGEYSPNNPETMGEGRNGQRSGDVFVGLGLYEERRKKLLLKRQLEYREYLAKQTHLNNLKKQAAIQQRHPPSRNLFLEEAKKSGRSDDSIVTQQKEWDKYNRENSYESRYRRPSSVGVQTDPEELLELERRSSNALITKAERELSPRPSVNGNVPPADWRMLVEKVNIGTQNNLIVPPSITDKNKYNDVGRLEYGNEYFDPFNGIGQNLFRKDSPRAKLLQDLRHTYMPSLFDADAIKQRNMQMEQETAAKRMTYQQELKKQIDEQQRIREEKKAREKLLEEAETRRLEEHLKMLKTSQDSEIDKQKQLAIRMRKDANEFERRRVQLQSDIDNEKKTVRNVRTNTVNEIRTTRTSRSDPVPRTHTVVSKQLPETERSHLPFYYSPPPKTRSDNSQSDMISYNIRRNNPYVGQDLPSNRLPYSTNIPDDSVFAQSIPVKNYNVIESSPVSYPVQRFTQEPARPIKRPIYNENIGDSKIFDGRNSRLNVNNYTNRINAGGKNVRPSYEPAFLSKNITEMIDTKNLRRNSALSGNFDDSLPIPVMREVSNNERTDGDGAMTTSLNSDAMKNVEQKWQVPAVQKNILRNNFTDDGKQENILTQLGSIRRQLQLEQLKLDQSQMFSKQKLIK